MLGQINPPPKRWPDYVIGAAVGFLATIVLIALST